MISHGRLVQAQPVVGPTVGVEVPPALVSVERAVQLVGPAACGNAQRSGVGVPVARVEHGGVDFDLFHRIDRRDEADRSSRSRVRHAVDDDFVLALPAAATGDGKVGLSAAGVSARVAGYAGGERAEVDHVAAQRYRGHADVGVVDHLAQVRVRHVELWRRRGHRDGLRTGADFEREVEGNLLVRGYVNALTFESLETRVLYLNVVIAREQKGDL